MKVQVLGTGIHINVRIENIEPYIDSKQIGVSSTIQLKRDSAIGYLSRYHPNEFNSDYRHNFTTMLKPESIVEFQPQS